MSFHFCSIVSQVREEVKSRCQFEIKDVRVMKRHNAGETHCLWGGGGVGCWWTWGRRVR